MSAFDFETITFEDFLGKLFKTIAFENFLRKLLKTIALEDFLRKLLFSFLSQLAILSLSLNQNKTTISK
jgi:hypothetical protein